MTKKAAHFKDNYASLKLTQIGYNSHIINFCQTIAAAHKPLFARLDLHARAFLSSLKNPALKQR